MAPFNPNNWGYLLGERLSIGTETSTYDLMGLCIFRERLGLLSPPCPPQRKLVSPVFGVSWGHCCPKSGSEFIKTSCKQWYNSAQPYTYLVEKMQRTMNVAVNSKITETI